MNYVQDMLDQLGPGLEFMKGAKRDRRQPKMRSVRHAQMPATANAQTSNAVRYTPAGHTLLTTTPKSITSPPLSFDRMPTVTSNVNYADDLGYSCGDISTTIYNLTPAYEAAKATVEDLIEGANLSGASIILDPDGTLTIDGVGGLTTELPSTLGDWVNVGVFEVVYSDMSEQLLQLDILATLYNTNGCWSQLGDPAYDPNQYGYDGSYPSGSGGEGHAITSIGMTPTVLISTATISAAIKIRSSDPMSPNAMIASDRGYLVVDATRATVTFRYDSHSRISV